ncbi:cyclic dehypoxanthinyl futalosine synthase, partial [Jatrophihabitans sp.]|uniref:cyclic dehypoxanthinyl futalosine synthase n=1 Tax=Jatrophihabitans sp. TaxID=1932789 RepID=UPI002B6E54A7|nr:cyclic dehypoxanthinyl futalosine synthase [Jatrophihabitans sp.]
MTPHSQPAEIANLLQHAADGGRITPEQALLLYTDAPLHALGEAADTVRRRRFGELAGIATYIIDRNINYTNVCLTACKFCAFYRAPGHREGWTHTDAEILRRCGEAVELGATQIMLQGGHSPELGIEFYERIFAAIKAEYPSLTLHSLGASEVVHIGRVSGLSHEEVIRRLHAAGLDSFAGAGAEILVSRPRTAIAPLKESGETWLEVMETAHRLGVESTATFMMGTGETNAERIEHLRMIRDVQDRTGGFRSFIPWTYQPENNHLKGRTQATSLEYLRMVALARLFFDNVTHLQGSWLTTGKDIGQLTLHFGADDLGSVMLEENVVSSAGARHRSNRTELIELIR